MNNYFALVLLLISCVVSRSGAQTEDYCWREYDGTIPSDAFSAGTEKNGSPIYLAQVLIQGKLVPGKIHNDGKNVYFEWFDLKNPKNLNTKIFCTKQPQKFEWLSTRSGKIANLAGKVLVKGGHEETRPTYVGRIANHGETSIGKVLCERDQCKGMYVSNDKSYREHRAFEILVFNPRAESVNVNCDPDIDVRMGAP